jgi:hypothetical protein
MDRRTPLALLETHGRLITEATYFPSLLEGCAAQTLSASGLQAPVSNVRFGSKAVLREYLLTVKSGRSIKIAVRENTGPAIAHQPPWRTKE